jgi:hypothetical protein
MAIEISAKLLARTDDVIETKMLFAAVHEFSARHTCCRSAMSAHEARTRGPPENLGATRSNERPLR